MSRRTRSKSNSILRPSCGAAGIRLRRDEHQIACVIRVLREAVQGAVKSREAAPARLHVIDHESLQLGKRCAGAEDRLRWQSGGAGRTRFRPRREAELARSLARRAIAAGVTGSAPGSPGRGVQRGRWTMQASGTGGREEAAAHRPQARLQ